jgi:hypothetical protein
MRKTTTTFLIACLALFGGCSLVDSAFDFGEEIGVVETVETSRTPLIDPQTGEQATDENGDLLWQIERHREIAPKLETTISTTFGGWGKLALGIASSLLVFFTTKKTIESSHEKKAVDAFITAAARAGVTGPIKNQLRTLPKSDKGRATIKAHAERIEST